MGRAGAVLKYIVEHIVDDPSQISIGATTDDRGPVLLLSVAEEDRGKVIGRQGRIVQAIRTVVKAATVGTGERVSVEIVD
ncbi:MAG: RNA-binding protein [Candidatus Eremiobacter antarcticus]|nr:KH domain-containing protein [Candidatus Eremiobacteraeota bacterium]MBC5808967.1 KH domain-containing protein [Candidatus Eremiobacteraeota bacterium]PZR60529.1 MAG: RNA-binding protein [Candidatus Eremiobacter sp. RRmetagenome_bin22]